MSTFDTLGTMKLLLLLLLFTFEKVSSLGCPKLTPVAVSEHFFYSLQPPDGFYAAIAWGEDSIPSYTPKPKPTLKPGRHKNCMRGRILVNNAELFTAPPVECSYDELSVSYCETGAGGTGTAAMAVAGITVPKYVEGYIVDTDNKTYMAVGGCLDGTLYQWSVLTTDPRHTQVKTSTLRALKVTPEQVKASMRKKMKPGRTQVSRGKCNAEGGTATGLKNVEGILL